VKCPQCGKAGTGKFCQHCGSPLGERLCNQCGAKLTGPARFCNQCGAAQPGAGAAPTAGVRGGGAHRAAAAATVGGSNAPWWIAGIAMLGLILVVGVTMVKPEGPAAPAGGMPPGAEGGNPAAGQSDLDLSSMTPREAADRLFDRVMRTVSAGDTAGALAFQPMAVQAYQVAEPLNLDGLFHQAMLEALADPQAALATAERMLAQEPDHVLALGEAAQVSLDMGDTAKAEEYFRHLVRVYDVQFARNLEEYDGHRNIMVDMKRLADAFLAGR
jgi:hypothetical protein